MHWNRIVIRLTKRMRELQFHIYCEVWMRWHRLSMDHWKNTVLMKEASNVYTAIEAKTILSNGQNVLGGKLWAMSQVYVECNKSRWPGIWTKNMFSFLLKNMGPILRPKNWYRGLSPFQLVDRCRNSIFNYLQLFDQAMKRKSWCTRRLADHKKVIKSWK